VNLLKRVVALVLLAAWLPATSLCLIERAGWLSSDDCCPSNTQNGSDQKPSHETTCCALASATYKADDDQNVNVAAPIAVLVADWNSLSVVESFGWSACPSLSISPPELPASWQFALRTALPPRAPSFVS
jgi:hypothetical protein